MCGASFQMPIHHLHEPIDVFSEWLDECEAAEKRKNGIDVGDSMEGMGAVGGIARSGGGDGGGGGGGEGARRDYEYDSEEEDNLPGSSGLTGAKGKNNNRPTPQQHSLATLGVGDSDDDSE